MQVIFTLTFLLFGYLVATAQNRVEKIVFVTPLQVPISDVLVQSDTRMFAALSNESGIVFLQSLPSNITAIQASHLGYEPATISLDSLASEKGRAVITLRQKDVTLEDVTVSAAGRKNAFRTLSDLAIRLRPVTNTQEVLRMVPGLFIGQHAGGGKAEQIFLRGFDVDHGTDINLSVDGLPVNMVSHAHGQGYADLHFVIPELIEKVHFQKGTYAADRGNFTTAGFVAFKTKSRLEKNFIKAEGGQFGTGRIVGGASLLKQNAGNPDQHLFFAGEAFSSRGYFESPQRFRRFNAMLKYQTAVGKTGSLTALLSGLRSRWNASGQIPEREVENGSIRYFGAVDPTEGGFTSRYNASVEMVNQSGSSVEWRNQVFYTNYDFVLYSNFTFFKEDPGNGDRIRQKERRHIFGYNGSYQKEYTLHGWQTSTTIGVQLRHDAVDNSELSRMADRKTLLSRVQFGDINETNAAAFASQKIMLHKKLSLNGGLRLDYFANHYQDHLTESKSSENAVLVSPKLMVDYHVNKNIHLYWYNGKGFHSNDTRVVVAQRGRRVLPPALSTDLGGIFKLTPKLVVQTALWHLWLDQEFVYVGDEGIVEAGGQTRRLGTDLSVRYEFLRNFFANLDLNYSSSKLLGEPKNENAIPLAPRFTSVGGIVYKKQSGFGGSVLYRLMGDRPAVEDNSLVAKGYCIVDANVLYTSPKWETGLSIQNLFNTRWKETQFATESRLQHEPAPVTEIHFTPGTPFFARLHFMVFF